MFYDLLLWIDSDKADGFMVLMLIACLWALYGFFQEAWDKNGKPRISPCLHCMFRAEADVCQPRCHTYKHYQARAARRRSATVGSQPPSGS
jgi:hypothetical protein